MAGLNTTELINNIKLRITSPNAQQLWTEASYIQFLNDELLTRIQPTIQSTFAEYFVDYVDYVIGANESEFDIPSNALGAKLRDVVLYDTQSGTSYNVPQIALEDVSERGAFNNFSMMFSFYVRNNKIVLFPTPQSQPYKLRLYFYRQLNQITPVIQTAKVVSIVDTPSFKGVVLDTVPTSFQVGQKICFNKVVQPYSTINSGNTILSVSFPTIELDNVNNISVGDSVCLDGYTIVPQIPDIWHPILAQAAAARALASIGDPNTTVAFQLYEQLREGALITLSPRVDGEVRKVTTVGRGIFNNGWRNSIGTFWRR